jgi:hypothetical protein
VEKGVGVIASLTIALGLMVGFSVAGRAQGFVLSKGTFALCTVAPCNAVPGSSKEAVCSCTVNSGYSVGQKAGQPAKATAAGEQIRSRYYPVQSYVICNNDRPWAWCLDKPCIISKNNPNAAACTCNVVKNLGAYVIVTNEYTPAACTKGIISSATVQQITQATDFLKKEGTLLPPYPIQVLTPPKHS